MLYFITSNKIQNNLSGVEKRANMWWHYWLANSELITEINFNYPSQKQSILERIFFIFFPFKWLPTTIQLYMFFSRQSIFQFHSKRRRLKKIFLNNLGKEDKIFVFRAYNLYLFSIIELDYFFTISSNIIIDFDESDYLCFSTYFTGNVKWEVIKNKVFIYEQTLLKHSNIKFFVSGKNEAINLQTIYNSAADIKIMPNKLGITRQFIKKKFQYPIKILIIGVYHYLPNEKMLFNLLNLIAPYVLNPDTFEFHIVGPNISPIILSQLKSYPFIKVHGLLTTEKLDQLYTMIHFNLTLLESGGGTKYKIIESLANNIPIIANDYSVIGLDLIPYVHYLPFNNFDKLLKYISSLINEQNKYHEMQQNCRNIYFNKFYFKSFI